MDAVLAFDFETIIAVSSANYESVVFFRSLLCKVNITLVLATVLKTKENYFFRIIFEDL